MLEIKQVQIVWKPKWSWFKPPKWFIFRWAYIVDVNSSVYKGDDVVCEATIQRLNTPNKNGRTYSSSVLMEQISHSDNVRQVQIGIMNNFYGEQKESEED